VPDTPENYQEVTWALSGRDGSTELTITERTPALGGGEGRVRGGLEDALTGLKALLER
jgi:hypothetical protein